MDKMDNIVQSIYSSCDPKNENRVPVTHLIEFIKPYMLNDLDELQELHTKLDPHNSNPSVNYAFFEKVMTNWIINLEGSKGFFEISSSQSSTPNVSPTKGYNSNPSTAELLEAHIKVLNEMLTKRTTDLDFANQQLLLCEDENKALLDDLNKMKNVQQCYSPRPCNQSQTTNNSPPHSETEPKFCEKCKQLENRLLDSEKLQKCLESDIKQLENQNEDVKMKLETLERRNRKQNELIEDITERSDLIVLENASLTEVIDDLKRQLTEKIESLSFYSEENTLNKERIKKLEALLLTGGLDNSQCLGLGTEFTINSPKLLNQLASPVSPILDSPQKIYDISSKYGYMEDVDSKELSLHLKFCHVVSSPHKTLLQELTEMNEYIDKNDAETQVESKDFATTSTQTSFSEEEKENVKVDKSTETDVDLDRVPVRTNVKKSSFAKQEIRIHKLQEQCDEMRRDLVREKENKTSLSLKYQQLHSENKQLQDDLFHRREEIDKIRAECVELHATRSRLEQEVEKSRGEMEELKQKLFQTESDVELCLSTNTKLLHSATMNVLQLFNFDDPVIETGELSREMEVRTNFEHELNLLTKNVHYISCLIRNLCDKFDILARETQFSQLPKPCESLVTFSRTTNESRTCDTNVLQMLEWEFDSFLDKLELTDVDLGSLTRKEMEEMFATLAVILAVDIPSLTLKYLRKKDNLKQLMLQFFAQLDDMIESSTKLSKILNREDRIIPQLKLLRSTGEQMLQAAVAHGVHHSEKRTVICWKYLINYTSLLIGENEKSKRDRKDTTDESCNTSDPINLNNNEYNVKNAIASRGISKKSFFIYSFLLAVVVLFVSVILYVDLLCSKISKRTCPIQWLTSFFVERSGSDDGVL